MEAVSTPTCEPRAISRPAIPDRVEQNLYGLALLTALVIWCVPIRAPLWLDETVSIFLIHGGLHGILARQVWPDSPTYSCLLWLWTQAMGLGEITLRVSSLLPMVGSVYLLYRAARQLFGREIAPLAALVFCLHPIIIFAAIDIRPYAFAALAINATILALVSLRGNNSIWLAALFGFLAGCIVQFQLLFAVILPPLAICFVVLKMGDRKVLWRQSGAALLAFCFAFLPAIPRLQYMAHTSATHVFAEAPTLLELGSTLSLKGMAAILLLALAVAAATRRLDLHTRFDRWAILLCSSLAFFPVLTLYILSTRTAIHVFVPRYRLATVPGIALCWALLAGRIQSRVLPLLVAFTLVAATAYVSLTTPFLRHHQYSWKYALALIQQNAAVDNAPVLLCSDIPESDHMTMPVGPAIFETGILPPLSYYPLTVPVSPLPRALNAEAIRAGSLFLEQAEIRHQRFLAAAFSQSDGTLDWLAQNAARSYYVRELGRLDGVRVQEFDPRP